ncbi:MAG: DNA polymerase III subunit gamma/tau [Planctomycetota bacterium]
MSYLVLARKYRPSRFEEVVGQTAVTRTLANAIRMGRVAHAYLFAGPRGVGKTSVARILAKALNCAQGPTPTPCGSCERCREISSGHDIDVREIDAASNRGIDHVRELRDNVRYAPAYGRFKVYIIDEVHQLTSESFNALLKTLEEPPQHVIFVFATTELEKVPETVRSRCQVFEFRCLTDEQIAAHLGLIAEQEGIQLEAGVEREVARRARGSLRDAQSLLDQLITLDEGHPTLRSLALITGSMDRQRLAAIVQAGIDERQAELLEIVGEACARGASVADIFEQLLDYLRDLLAARAGYRGLAAPQEELGQQARVLDTDRILAMMQVVLQGRARLRDLDDARLILEMTLLKLSRVAGSLDLAAALSYLRRLRLSTTSAAPSVAPPARRSGTDDRAGVGRPATAEGARAVGSPSAALQELPEAAVGGQEPRGADEAFSRFTKALGGISRPLAAFVGQRFNPALLRGRRLEVVDKAPGEARLYDLTKSPHREIVEKALVAALGPGATWHETVPSGNDAPDGVARGSPRGSSPRDVVDRARDVLGGDIVVG